MICLFSRILEPDSASVICCIVQLADYAGAFISNPPRPCLFAPFKPPRVALTLSDSFIHRGTTGYDDFFAANYLEFQISRPPHGSPWALRIGPVIGLEIQAKHANHTLQPPIKTLYQRSASVAQPPIPSLPLLFTTVLYIPLSPCHSTSLSPSARLARMS